MPQPTSSRPSRIERGLRIAPCAQPNRSRRLRVALAQRLARPRLAALGIASRRSCAAGARAGRSSARRPARPSRDSSAKVPGRLARRAHERRRRRRRAAPAGATSRRSGTRTSMRVCSRARLDELVERATSPRRRRGASPSACRRASRAERDAAASCGRWPTSANICWRVSQLDRPAQRRFAAIAASATCDHGVPLQPKPPPT